MQNRIIRVTTVVPSMKVGDVTYNIRAISEAVTANSTAGLLVFPELCITGYTCGDLFSQEALLRKAEEGLMSLADITRKFPGLTAVVGLPFRFRTDLYNCAAVLHGGRICGLVPKTHIPTYNEFYESRWFASGADLKDETVRIGGEEIPFGTQLLFEDRESGAVLGIEICEDLWVPDKPGTHLCLAGANIIVNPSASDEIIGKEDYRRDMVRMQSAACYCVYAYVSAGMDESSTDLVYSGHALIAENGRILAEGLFPERPHAESALVDPETCDYNRRRQSTFTAKQAAGFRRIPVRICPVGGPELSAAALSETLKAAHYPIPRNPFVPAEDRERSRRCRRILEIQANGLASRVRATGIRTLVIGISGGLDSTLALLVCHEARKLVPDIRIIGYTMPNRGNTSDLTYRNALQLMQALQVEIREVPIEDGVRAHLIDIGHGPDYKGEGDTTYENAQARMRTYILMDAANMENGLVVGTGDLSELALGWCTYNGDHMSMYAVNASIPKTLVQYICRVYADMCGNTLLQETLLSVLDTPISPELTPSVNGQIAQKTEEKIGKYDLNDFFMFYLMRYGFSPAKILAFAMTAYPELQEDFIRKAEERFLKRFFSQQFKRSCLPDGPKVGSVTLSPRGDWRMPSDASVKLWLEELEKA